VLPFFGSPIALQYKIALYHILLFELFQLPSPNGHESNILELLIIYHRQVHIALLQLSCRLYFQQIDPTTSFVAKLKIK
jgi:hypothetical protein